MDKLPSGTVTFFFSDIEGSTGLVQGLGADYPAVLADHSSIIRGALRGTDGTEVRTEGDSFFIVFTSAAEAVTGACEIQRRMEEHDWPTGGVVRVRIGLHTGNGELGGDDYVGLDVVRAARIGDAGHGGQIVVSAETAEAVATDLRDAEITDLGPHRLRGLEEPERLYQVTPAGFPTTFPPLRTERLTTNNLPVQLTTIIGRDDDTDLIAALIATERLVTLVGPGGVGKTRLALQIGSEVLDTYPGGVWVIDLAPVRDDALVLPEVASVVGATEASVESVVRAVGDRAVLLILDNLEQLPGVATLVLDLLGAASNVSVLGTSQVPLRVQGERAVRVPPLGAEGNGASSPAVALFAQRAAAADPFFDLDAVRPDVTRLVAALDGLPLAIELAAARSNLLAPAEILERIEAGYDLQGGSFEGPERHRSMEAAMAWTVDLLDDAARAALGRFIAFRGGASLAAAEIVVAGEPVADALETIGELVDRSLLLRKRSQVASFRLDALGPLQRFVADQPWGVVEAAAATAAHTTFFLDLAEQAEGELLGRRAGAWLKLLDEDLDNLRAVLDRLIDAGDARRALAMLGALWRFYQGRGLFSELRIWLDRAFALPGADEASIERARGLMAMGAVEYWRENGEVAIDAYREAVDLARSFADEAALAAALFGLASSLMIAGRSEGVDPLLDEAEGIFRRLGDAGGVADIVGGRTFRTLVEGDPSGAREGVDELIELYTAAGRVTYATHGKLAAGAIAIHEGRYEDARALALVTLDAGQALGDRFVQVWSVEWLAMCEIETERSHEAAVLAGACERAREASAGWTPVVYGLESATSRIARVLDDEEMRSLLDLGRAIDFEEAVKLAKHDIDLSSLQSR